MARLLLGALVMVFSTASCVFPPPPLEETEPVTQSAAVNVQEIQPLTSAVQRLNFNASTAVAFDLALAIQVPAGQVRPHADWWVAFGPNSLGAWTRQTDRMELNPCDKDLNNRIQCEPSTVPCVKTFQVEALVTTGVIVIDERLAEPRQTRDGEPVTVVQWTVTITGDENQCTK